MNSLRKSRPDVLALILRLALPGRETPPSPPILLPSSFPLPSVALSSQRPAPFARSKTPPPDEVGGVGEPNLGPHLPPGLRILELLHLVGAINGEICSHPQPPPAQPRKRSRYLSEKKKGNPPTLCLPSQPPADGTGVGCNWK